MREVRKVPSTWEHPKNEKGRYIPLLGGSFSQLVKAWDEGEAMWEKGKCRDYTHNEWVDIKEKYRNLPFGEYDGERPEERHYMPEWDENECTHFMMYETVDGTPISPAFLTREELARWLADNNASVCAYQTATYEQWLRICDGGGVLGTIEFSETDPAFVEDGISIL